MQDVLATWRTLEQLDGALENPKIPTWRFCFRRLLLLQPSAACVERLWSLFSILFADREVTDALMDYIETALMLNYNHRND